MKKIVEGQIILFPSDLLVLLNSAKWKIFLFSLLLSLLAFSWKITRPLIHEAEGVFQSGAEASREMSHAITKIFGESYSFASSPDKNVKSILTSLSLMERVVKKLSLQAELLPEKKESVFTRIKNNLLTEYSYYFYGTKKKPFSKILSKKQIIPEKLLIREKELPFCCKNVTYEGQVYTTLSLFFTKEEGFSIYDSNDRYLGRCQPGTEFRHDNFSFTLHRVHPLEKGRYILTLIPLREAAEALKETIDIKRDKENIAVLNIHYKGTDKNLSSKIVNSVMEEYQNFLENIQQKNTSKHLAYLKERKEQITDEFFSLLQEEKSNLGKGVQKGGFTLLDHEMAYLDNQQGKSKEQLFRLAAEILRLDHIRSKNFEITPSATVEEAIGKVKEQTSAALIECEGLNISSTQELLSKATQELDSLCVEINHYCSLLKDLPNPDFEVSHLASVLHDPSLKEFYIKTHELQLALLDPKNWSNKEKERIKKDLDTTKLFLASHLEQLEKSSANRKEIMQEKVNQILFYLLELYTAEYEKTVADLRDLSSVAQSIPEKWVGEKLLTFNEEMSATLLESVSKVIESKNLSYHLKTYEASPLAFAYPNTLAQKPNLRLYLILGFCTGLGICALAVLFFALIKGPRATKSNLCALEIPAFSPQDENFIEEVYCFLQKYPLATKIGIVNFKSPFLPSLLKKLDEEKQSYDIFPFPKQVATSSARFTFFSTDLPINTFAFACFEKEVDLLLFEAQDLPLQPFILLKTDKPWGVVSIPSPKKPELEGLKKFKEKFSFSPYFLPDL